VGFEGVESVVALGAFGNVLRAVRPGSSVRALATNPSIHTKERLKGAMSYVRSMALVAKLPEFPAGDLPVDGDWAAMLKALARYHTSDIRAGVTAAHKQAHRDWIGDNPEAGPRDVMAGLAHFEATCAQHAFTVLQMPKLDRHTAVNNADWAGVVAYRLNYLAPAALGGVQQEELPPDLTCGACASEEPLTLFHAASSMLTGHRTREHHRTVHVAREVLTESGFGVFTEPRNFLEDNKRSDMHVSYNGMMAATDHSIACAHGSQHARHASVTPGAHIAAVEVIKDTKYKGEYSRDWGAKFFP
jgi:hypothetical protein